MRCSVFASLGIALLLVSCGSKKRGGDSFWRATCSPGDDCGDYTCVCGFCTTACERTEVCLRSGSVCRDTSEIASSGGCPGWSISTPPMACWPVCAEDADCPDGASCIDGDCIADASEPEPAAEGNEDLLAALDNIEPVDASVDWSSGVAVPAPGVEVEGADDRILGTWVEHNCEPEEREGRACITLEIRDDGGRVRGTVTLDTPDNDLGPFETVRDANAGYPRELDPGDYRQLTLNAPGAVPLTVLDGHQNGDRVTFGFSPMDIWTQWCREQPSYPWQVRGRTLHFCVPQQEDQWADLGSAVLCTSPEYGELCDTDTGARRPCWCTGPDDNNATLCQEEYCRCDAEGCGPVLDRHQYMVELTIDGDQLVGSWGRIRYDDHIVLDKEAP